MGERLTCTTCGGSGFVVSDGLAGAEQTLSDRDQTASDQDQTSSDHDQTASDRDSASAADDQAASDQDLAGGGDRELHEQTRLARARTAETRDEVSGLRDETAEARRLTADERDRDAAERDRAAADRDRKADYEQHHPDAAVAELLAHAERDRARAAADRVRAAADRAAAARDRAEARRVQAEAHNLIKAASSDELTGVTTRTAGFDLITREIDRAGRSGRPLIVALVAIDDLNAVEDSDGRPAGDRLLRLAAEMMQTNLRLYDVVVRYSDDVFLLAMPNTSKDAAADRLKLIATTLAGTGTGHSIRFGLAAYEPDDGIAELISRARADLLATRRHR